MRDTNILFAAAGPLLLYEYNRTLTAVFIVGPLVIFTQKRLPVSRKAFQFIPVISSSLFGTSSKQRF